MIIVMIACAVISMPLVYKFLVPLFSGGKVQFKLKGVVPCIVFGMVLSVIWGALYWWWVMLFCEGFAGVVYEILKPTNALPQAVSHIEMPVILVLVSHSVFFCLTLFLSRTAPNIVAAESGWAIWRAAWAPVIVFKAFELFYTYFNKFCPIP